MENIITLWFDVEPTKETTNRHQDEYDKGCGLM